MLSLLFPGQGTQTVGMLSPFISAFKSAQDTVNEIEDSVSCHISRTIDNGPLEELTRTDNAQLAIFTVSMAAISVLTKEFGFNVQNNVKYLAGHSLGELSALCVAGVLDIRQMARLVQARGKAMQTCCENPEEFAMAAVLKASIEDVAPLLSEYSENEFFCGVANDNSKGQIVLSGHKKAVEQAAAKCASSLNSKIVFLNTSGPFHTHLMSKAIIQLEEYILKQDITYNSPQIPVISNVTAQPIFAQDKIHEELVRQIISRVQWRKTIDFLAQDQDVNMVIEIAPGRVLTSMLKREYPDKETVSLDTIAKIEQFVTQI